MGGCRFSKPFGGIKKVALPLLQERDLEVWRGLVSLFRLRCSNTSACPPLREFPWALRCGSLGIGHQCGTKRFWGIEGLGFSNRDRNCDGLRLGAYLRSRHPKPRL